MRSQYMEPSDWVALLAVVALVIVAAASFVVSLSVDREEQHRNLVEECHKRCSDAAGFVIDVDGCSCTYFNKDLP